MSLESALLIESGAELLQFDLGTVEIHGTKYTVLTGYEGTPGVCFWCGEKLKGKLKRYCYGHMTLYYNHFEWGSASRWVKERAGNKCENCGEEEGPLIIGQYSVYYHRTNLEIHHIVPLNGDRPQFSAYHLPWNLCALCHACHQEIHAIMRPPPRHPPNTYDEAIARGQGILV